MKNTILHFAQLYVLSVIGLLGIGTAYSQNIFIWERVQVVDAFQGYSTVPYGTDYRTTSYRLLSTQTGTPVDGRGQWSTTVNIQNNGSDAKPINMTGGNSGFFFITGPKATPFQNKWVFASQGQAALDKVNDVVYNGASYIGLNMTVPGYYRFVFNDCGYKYANAKFFVARTDSVPVKPTWVYLFPMGADTLVGKPDTVIGVAFSTKSKPTANENFYIRYVTSANADFSGSTKTYIVKALGTDTLFAGVVPFGSKYYIFSSTRSLLELNSAPEIEKSLSVLEYDDNGGKNYQSPSGPLPLGLLSFSGKKTEQGISLTWTTSNETNAAVFAVEKLIGAKWSHKANKEAKNGLDINTYTYSDPVVDATDLYRLRLIDKDGTSKLSYAIIIDGSVTGEEIMVFPTLVQNGNIKIHLNEPSASKTEVKLFSINGRLLRKQTYSFSSGSNWLDFPLGSLKGMAIVQVNTATSIKTQKIVIE